MTVDHLGSPRVVTNENGAVTSRKDFTAFGEQNYTAQRTETLGYEPDTIRKGYTGYEKDDESGLDFAQARYYNSTHGRYTSVDPLTASASIKDPQTFNRYSYVLNSPYKFTDPLGLIPESTVACGNRCPNSGGGYVDGSAFRGRDATFDWAKQSSPPPPPPAQQQATDPWDNIPEDAMCNPDHPFWSYLDTPASPSSVAPDSPQVISDNAALTELFTSGTGAVVTNRSVKDFFYGDAPTHFRYQDGQIITIHINASKSGTGEANVYAPPGFEVTYSGGKSNTVVAQTGEFITYLHISGPRSQANLNSNLKSTNKAGWRLIGQTGGPGGNDPGRLHACIKIYSSPANYGKARDQYNPNKSGTGPVTRSLWGDFRRFIK